MPWISLIERGRVNYRDYEDTGAFLEKVNDALYAVWFSQYQNKKVAMHLTVIVLSFNDTDAAQRLLLTLLPFSVAFFASSSTNGILGAQDYFLGGRTGRFGFALPSDESISAKLSNSRPSDLSMPGPVSYTHLTLPTSDLV